jgi:hypothetical protein
MVVRQVFQRIWNAMDRLEAVMAAGIYRLVEMWLEGVIAYASAVHGYVPGSNLSRNSPSGDDERGSRSELNKDPDGMRAAIEDFGLRTHGYSSNLRDSS